jgi:hypothetical protein
VRIVRNVAFVVESRSTNDVMQSRRKGDNNSLTFFRHSLEIFESLLKQGERRSEDRSMERALFCFLQNMTALYNSESVNEGTGIFARRTI